MDDDLPQCILNDPDYRQYLKALAEGGDSDSGRKEIKDFLAPTTGTNFIDLGCCLNLMIRSFDQWPSLYHGIDISSETIELLNEFVARKRITVGSLVCTSIHETPYEDDSFDIGACIGVLEYFDEDFVRKALFEAHRILKSESRFVLDVPDNSNPMRRFMKLIEDYRGCPNEFDLSMQRFEALLHGCFEIVKKESITSVGMIQYFLISK